MQRPAALSGPAGGEASGWPLWLKVGAIGVLVVLLQIPLLLIRGVVGEREQRRDEAVAEIANTWGGEQILAGPFLVVPYTRTTRVVRDVFPSGNGRSVKSEELREAKGSAWFLPAALEVSGSLEPETRYRGIFRAPVYTARLTVRGRFKPEVEKLGLDDAAFDWNRARVLVAVSDPSGLRTAPSWTVEGAGRAAGVFEPSDPQGGWPALIGVGWGADSPEAFVAGFSIDVLLQGTRRLAIAPTGAETRASLQAAWPDPSFDGASLPIAREISPEGFEARWEISRFGRGYPQQWNDEHEQETIRGATVSSSAFGVSLTTPVDAYRMVDRSLKYALLFLSLVFAAFFAIEHTAGVQVHPLQYLMVGGALALFYLGFLALAEFVPVAAAYGSAACASTILITAYSAAVLRSGRRTVLLGAGIAGVYGYLFFILQLQDYALLAGTAALFALLAVGMWITRRVDRLDLRRPRATCTENERAV